MRRTLLPFVAALALAGCGGDNPPGPTLEGVSPPVDGDLAPEAGLQPEGALAPEATVEPETTLEPDSTIQPDANAPQEP